MLFSLAQQLLCQSAEATPGRRGRLLLGERSGCTGADGRAVNDDVVILVHGVRGTASGCKTVSAPRAAGAAGSAGARHVGKTCCKEAIAAISGKSSSARRSSEFSLPKTCSSTSSPVTEDSAAQQGLEPGFSSSLSVTLGVSGPMSTSSRVDDISSGAPAWWMPPPTGTGREAPVLPSCEPSIMNGSRSSGRPVPVLAPEEPADTEAVVEEQRVLVAAGSAAAGQRNAAAALSCRKVPLPATLSIVSAAALRALQAYSHLRAHRGCQTQQTAPQPRRRAPAPLPGRRT